MELMRLQVIPQEQVSPIDDLQPTSKPLHCLNRLIRRIRNFQLNRLLQRHELIASLSQQLDSLVDLRENTCVDQVSHCDCPRFICCLEVTLFDVVGQFAKIKLLQVLVPIETVLAEAKLGKAT